MLKQSLENERRVAMLKARRSIARGRNHWTSTRRTQATELLSSFDLDDRIPGDSLLRGADQSLDLSDLRQRLGSMDALILAMIQRILRLLGRRSVAI